MESPTKTGNAQYNDKRIHDEVGALKEKNGARVLKTKLKVVR
jgi:hypothetical protein